MSKRTLALIILALLLIGGLGVWWFFGRPTTPSQTETPSLPTTNLLPITSSNNSGVSSSGVATSTTNLTPTSDISSIANQHGLSRLVLGPITSITVSPTASNTIVYLEKTTGNLYSFNLEVGTPIRLTNTTIPAIQEVFWGNDKKAWHIITRDLKDNAVENILSSLSIASSTNGGVSSLDSVGLSDAIYNVTINPGRNTWFYLTNQNGSTVGITADLNNKNQKTIFRSPFTEWLAMWPSANTIFLQTKAGQGITGFLYQLNQTSGQLTKIVDGLGLTTTISPDGQKIIYTESTPGNLTSSIKLIKDGSVKELPIKVVPDKCVWSKDAATIFCAVPTNLSGNQNFPDAWYQGVLSFNDSIWKIDTKTLTPTNLYTPARNQNDIAFDATKLILGAGENTLLFINKNDGSLWSFNLRDSF